MKNMGINFNVVDVVIIGIYIGEVNKYINRIIRFCNQLPH